MQPADAQNAVVVKLYMGPARNPLFPNDPSAEAQILLQFENSRISPDFVAAFSTSLGECNVYSHIPGKTWAYDASSVGKSVAVLHSAAPPKGLRIVPNGSEELTKQTVSILAKCTDSDSISNLVPQGSVAKSSTTCLLHGDIVPGNIISNSEGLHFIDWQCPAIGDPCEDIAIFLSPAMQCLYRGSALNDDEIQSFAIGYNAPDVMTRYAELAPWYHWRMAAYCQWQVENGQLDYEIARDLEVAALQRSLSA